MNDAGRESFRLTNEISPIILTNGIASDMPGGLLPIIAITQGADFDSLLASANGDLDLDNFWAHFKPLPGASLIDNQLGKYPFANQIVAANAVIAQPLRVSLMMICPARQAGDYPFKLSTFQAVQAALYQHTIEGGTYTVVTPSWVYYNCILTGLRDASSGQSLQVQDAWQWDFEQPLLTQAQAEEAENSLMGKLTAQVPVGGDPPSYSGTAPSVGLPGSGVGASLIPSATSLGGSIVGQFGAAFGGGGPAAVQRLSQLAVGSLAGPAGSAALESFVSAGATSRIAQVALNIAGPNVVGAASVLAGKAVQAAQTAVMAANGGSARPAAQRALNFATATLSGSQASLVAALTTEAKTAVTELIATSRKSVDAAATALQLAI